MAKRYAVDEVRDDSVRLRYRLDEIASEGGKVISIMWQPAREVQPENYAPNLRRQSGYVVVSEYEFPDAHRT